MSRNIEDVEFFVWHDGDLWCAATLPNPGDDQVTGWGETPVTAIMMAEAHARKFGAEHHARLTVVREDPA